MIFWLTLQYFDNKRVLLIKKYEMRYFCIYCFLVYVQDKTFLFENFEVFKWFAELKDSTVKMFVDGMPAKAFLDVFQTTFLWLTLFLESILVLKRILWKSFQQCYGNPAIKGWKLSFSISRKHNQSLSLIALCIDIISHMKLKQIIIWYLIRYITYLHHYTKV